VRPSESDRIWRAAGIAVSALLVLAALAVAILASTLRNPF